MSKINSLTLETFSPEEQDLLNQHFLLVQEVNKQINLTRITTYEEAKILHIEDSLAALPELEAAPEGNYGDLGTGAGFPGIPLSIVTKREVLLIDSVQKKMKALDGIVQQMGLRARISTYAGRIEDLSIEQPERFSVLTTRALSSLPSLLELASPLLVENGQLICFKAQMTKEELEAGLSLEKMLGMSLLSDREFFLSDGTTRRRILVFKKTGHPTIKLPRRLGQAQKHPLSS